MYVRTNCKFCDKEIFFDTTIGRAFEKGLKRIHICDNRITKCGFCKKLIYFSYKKTQKGKRQVFDAETQQPHICTNKKIGG